MKCKADFFTKDCITPEKCCDDCNYEECMDGCQQYDSRDNGCEGCPYVED
ncbi:MAG: hypothetical protein KH304_10720 [Clostridium sp.]|nr:hypothetical protein [Clostridium sp.]